MTSDASHRERRATVYAALGDALRLAIVDELVASDRSPGELADRLGIASNLIAHHLQVLHDAGLVRRSNSSGDARRRYVRLERTAFEGVVTLPRPVVAERVVFLCTRNSARSQLAAALWRARTGRTASSAGTHPAARVHPGAITAARRAGIDLSEATPRVVDDIPAGTQVITVCDQVHEELVAGPDWWHWSIPDPVPLGTARAFDDAVRALDQRIGALLS